MGTYSSHYKLSVKSYTNNSEAFPQDTNWGIFFLSIPLLEGNWCVKILMPQSEALILMTWTPHKYPQIREWLNWVR